MSKKELERLNYLKGDIRNQRELRKKWKKEREEINQKLIELNYELAKKGVTKKMRKAWEEKMRIYKDKNKEYEKLKKSIKHCKPDEYERRIKEICKKLKY